MESGDAIDQANRQMQTAIDAAFEAEIDAALDAEFRAAGEPFPASSIEADLSPVPPAPAPTEQPPISPEAKSAPISAPAVPMAMPDQPQPAPAREAVSGPEAGASQLDAMPPIEVGSDSSFPVNINLADKPPGSPVARPVAETAQGASVPENASQPQGQAAGGAALPQTTTQLPTIEAMTGTGWSRDAVAAQASKEGVAPINPGKKDPWIGFSRSDIAARIQKHREAGMLPETKPEQPAVISTQNAQGAKAGPPSVKMYRTYYGEAVWLDESEVAGEKSMLRMYRKDGKRIDGKNIIRGNVIELAGEETDTRIPEDIRAISRERKELIRKLESDGYALPASQPLDTESKRGQVQAWERGLRPWFIENDGTISEGWVEKDSQILLKSFRGILWAKPPQQQTTTAQQPATKALRKGEAATWKGKKGYISARPRLLAKTGRVEFTEEGSTAPKVVRLEDVEVLNEFGQGNSARQGTPEALPQGQGRGQDVPQPRELPGVPQGAEVQGTQAGAGGGVEGEKAVAEPVATTTADGQTVTVPMSKKAEKSVTMKEQKEFLLAEIDKAIEQAPKSTQEEQDFPRTVTIKVPNDGTFTIPNGRKELEYAKKVMKARFPTKVPQYISPTTDSGTEDSGRDADAAIDLYGDAGTAAKKVRAQLSVQVENGELDARQRDRSGRLADVLERRAYKSSKPVNQKTAKQETIDAQIESGSYPAVFSKDIREQREREEGVSPHGMNKDLEKKLADGKKPEPKPGELDDFGVKLGGARKDMQPSLSRELTDDEIATKTFSEIWPKAEVEAIEDNGLAAVVTAFRAAVPNKPRKGYKLERWVGMVKALRSNVQNFQENGITQDIIMSRIRGSGMDLIRDLGHKIELLGKIERAQWGRIGDVNYCPDAYSYGKDGQRIRAPFSFAYVDGHRVNSSSPDALAEAVQTKLSGDSPEPVMKFEFRRIEKTGEVFINKVGDPLRRKLKVFPDFKSADTFRKENYDLLVKAWEDLKANQNVKETDVRLSENRPRTGKDHRKGVPATPEMFTEAFGFRGVEFGNWVSQGRNIRERQGMLDAAYDALMDLADIAGVPPRAISMDGTLGLGLGSRGHGWASAHYEPSTLVINLTKTRGAGTLAHEWFHALDHYFQRKRGEGGRERESIYITYNPETYYQDSKGYRLPAKRFIELREKKRLNKAGDWKRIEGVRPEVEEKFDALVKALDASPMAKRSSLIDKGQSGYWSRVIERAARAFENYIIAKMQQKGYDNDYLANVATVEKFMRDPGRYPYLMADELAPIEKAFDELFGTIQTRETERGVAMFATRRKADGDTPEMAEIRKKYQETQTWMKAPNGEPTMLTEQQWLEARTPAYKKRNGDWEVAGAVQFALNGEPVVNLSGNEFQPDGVPLTIKVTKYYAGRNGGVAVNPELGSVRLDLEGVKDSLGHGIGSNKAAAYAAVPLVIEHGRIFDRQKNWKNRDFNTVVLVAPIQMAGQEYVCEVVVKQRPSRTGFYLHEVEIKGKLEGAFKTPTEGSAPRASKLILSQFVDERKHIFNGFLDENGEPKFDENTSFSTRRKGVEGSGDVGITTGDENGSDQTTTAGGGAIREAYAGEDAGRRAQDLRDRDRWAGWLGRAQGSEARLSAGASGRGTGGGPIAQAEIDEAAGHTEAFRKIERLFGAAVPVSGESFKFDGAVTPDGVALFNSDAIRSSYWENLAKHEYFHDSVTKGRVNLDRMLPHVDAHSVTFKRYRASLISTRVRNLREMGLTIPAAERVTRSELTRRDVVEEFLADWFSGNWQVDVAQFDLADGIRKIGRAVMEKRRAEFNAEADAKMAGAGTEVDGRAGSEQRGGLKKKEIGQSPQKEGGPKYAAGVNGQTAVDKEYMAAVERGDMENAQRIVDEAAKQAGYNVGPVYHGTPKSGFNVFKYRGGMGGHLGFWFASKKSAADMFARNRYAGVKAETKTLYLDPGNQMTYHGWGEFVDHVEKLRNGRDIDSGVKSLRRSLMARGYDGVKIIDSDTDGGPIRDDYAVFSPSQIKSADSIVRDDAGRIIPPSERFSPRSTDIRYAAKADPTQADQTEWDGAEVQEYQTAGGNGRYKIVVAGKAVRSGFGSEESAGRFITEQKARMDEDYAAIMRRTKASIADIAEARRKLDIALSGEKMVATDVLDAMFKAMGRLDIMDTVHKRELLAEIKRTASERKSDTAGWARRTTDKVWEIASRISYMKELREIFDKKHPLLMENMTLQAKPKYDAFVNQWIGKAKEYAELTPDQVNERIEAMNAAQLNRMADTSEEIAEETDDAVRDRYLLSTFGGLFRGASYAQAKQAFEAAWALVNEGRQKFMEIENARKREAGALRLNMQEDTKGGRELDATEAEMATRNKSIWEVLSGAGNWMHSTVLSGPYLANHAFDTRTGVKDMSGAAMALNEMETKAIEQNELLNEQVREDVTEIMAGAMDLKDPTENAKEARVFSKTLHDWRKNQLGSTGIYLHKAIFDKDGSLVRVDQGSELHNSPANILYYWLIHKRSESAAKQKFTNKPVEIEGGFNSIMEALVHNQMTAETFKQIEEKLDPRLIKIGWKMLEYMRDHSRPEVERLTFRLLGAVPPMYGDWYFPMQKQHDTKGVAGGRNAFTLVQSFMKVLTPNLMDLRPSDPFEVFLSHFDDLNHVSAHIDIVDLENRVIRNREMQRTLRIYRGDSIRKAVNNHLDRLTLGGEAGVADSLIRKFRSLFARSVIPNPTQIPKQMSSMLLFSTRELPPGANIMDWFLGVGSLVARPKAAVEFNRLLNQYSVRYRERYGHGYNQQVREARRGATAGDLLGKRMAWFEAMNFFPQMGDKLSSLFGGYPVYALWEKHFREVEKNPPALARERAMKKFMDAVDLTQQSGALPYLSDSQVGLSANLMMFKTQPTAMTRLWMNSMRNIVMKRGTLKENIWSMVAVILAQMFFQAWADAFFVAAFDDPDEWKRLRHNQIRAAVFAPINGFLIVPEALLRMTKIAMKDKVYGDFAGDVLSYMDVVDQIGNLGRLLMKDEELTGSEWMDVVQDTGSVVGAFTGKPVAPTIRWGRGIYDAATDDTLSPAGRVARAASYGKEASGQDKPRAVPVGPYRNQYRRGIGPYRQPWER